MRINEVYKAVQGEGPLIGVPSTFVRLSECDLKCSWCDTPYTWDWDAFDRSKESIVMEPLEVATKAKAFALSHYVFTGGEPLLQQGELSELFTLLGVGEQATAEVETNGTIFPHVSLTRRVPQWNVSPKLANSGNSERARQHFDVLRRFADLTTSYFKFVVMDDRDVREALMLSDFVGLPRERVLFMAEGTTREQQLARLPWLLGAAATAGVRATPRMHVLAYGPRRGV